MCSIVLDVSRNLEEEQAASNAELKIVATP